MTRFLWCILLASFSATAFAALPNGFVYLKDVDPTIIQDMRYAGSHNFVGRPIKDYQAATCILTKEAAQSLKNVQTQLRKQHLSLKVYDCYRPVNAVADFMAWSNNAADEKMKNEFYPRVAKNQLFHDGYIATHSGHSRGSTVDLTIVDPAKHQAAFDPNQKLTQCYAPVNQRFQDNSIDMGTGYDCLDTTAFPASTAINPEAHANRMQLQRVMVANGFEPYDKEWWHFSLKNEPYPKQYFNFPVK
jgi:D-alanyl-D-alanine dipeptidase